MHTLFRRSVLLGFAFSFVSLGSGTVLAAEGDEDAAIEEVIVTGSFIRRDNFDTPSPMSTMTELDIELAGTSDLGDMFFDQTYQFGVAANAAPFDGTTGQADDQRFNQGQEVAANLRGLGTRATMTMIDGHRLPGDASPDGRRVGVDINATYPSIAIGRVETILDGASALYGAEAVSGVINLIPKKDFEGIQISYDQQQALDDGVPSTSLQALFGVQGERGGAIFAVEIRDQERMELTRRPDYIITSAEPWTAAGWTPFWNDANGDFGSPSSFIQPSRDANGDLVADATDTFEPVGTLALGTVASRERIDPGCAHPFANGNDRLPNPDGSAGGVRAWFNGPDELNEEFRTAMDSNGNPIDRFEVALTGDSDLQKPANHLNGFIDMLSPRSPPGDLNGFNEDCRMTSSDIQDMQAESEMTKAYSYFEYELNDFVEVRGELLITENDYNTRNFPGQFDEVSTSDLFGPRSPQVIGDNPGNPFRAFADGGVGVGGFAGIDNDVIDWQDDNGNGLYEYLEEPGEYLLYAQESTVDPGFYLRDLDGDGNADQGGERNPGGQPIMLGLGDANGNGIPDRFDPDAPGNIIMNDDVRAQRDLGVHPKQPRNNSIEWVSSDGGFLHQERRTVRSNQRFRLGTTIQIPDTDWIADVDYVWSRSERTSNNSGANQNGTPEPIITAYVSALRCQGGPNQDACWNPFSTTYLQTNEAGQVIGDPNTPWPEDDDPGWRPADDPATNDEFENRIAGIVQPFTEQILGQQMVDATISTGNLFELPWNDQPVGFAFGYHWREEDEEFRPPVISQALIGGASGGLFSSSSPGRRESVQTTNAIFAEFNFALLESETWGSMELQLAARYAEIETRGILGQQGKTDFDTTIPKIAFRWAPRDWFAIRASVTEGFVTPGLFSLFGEPTTSTSTAGVADYICDNVAEIADCLGTVGGLGTNGVVQDVIVGASPNSDLGAETSDLWNAGISFRLLDGDLNIDVDYTDVDFDGRVDRIGAAANVSSNAGGFTDFVASSCAALGPVADQNGRTMVDHDNQDLYPSGTPQFAYTQLSATDFAAMLPQAELDCREAAAAQWINTAANGGIGETSVGDTRLERGKGPNGLGLSLVEDPWLEQGQASTASVIYNVRYGFDSSQIPLIGGDYGRFMVTLEATQMVKQELTRYQSLGCDMPNEFGTCPNDHPWAGITADGLGNSNGTIFVYGSGTMDPMPPTPEWRLNLGLRWFMGNHTAQLRGRWHDSITNIVTAWDQYRERGLLSAGQALQEQSTVCSQQPFKICTYDAEQYWDISYTYHKDDVFSSGVGLTANLAIRNVFDNFPEPQVGFASHNQYLDNIMGRMAFFRITATL